MSLNILELHAIVQFMSPNQKRRFTMQCQLSKANSNSLVLFNALNKLKKYDREKLNKELRKHGRTKLVDNLITETILLYKLILKLMKFSADEKSIEKKLENDFNDIVFIQAQGFFVRSQRMLQKVKKDAEKHDQSALLLRIYKYERGVNRGNNEYEDLSSIEGIQKKELELLDDMVLERKLMHINDKVFFLFQNITVLEEKVANKLLYETETADRNAVLKCIEEMQGICEVYENSNMVLDFRYASFLANYLNYLIIYDKPQGLVSKVLTKVKSIKPT